MRYRENKNVDTFKHTLNPKIQGFKASRANCPQEQSNWQIKKETDKQKNS